MPTSTSLAVTLLLASISLPLAAAETAAASAPKASSVTPVVSPYAPNNAVSVSPVLLSFSIEGDGWPEWAAKAPKYNQRNEFFYSALKNLKDRTGTWPNVRVGANSEDRTLFDKKIKIIQETSQDPTTSLPYPEAPNITVGPGYYTLSKFLPSGTDMTWGFNFGSENLTLARIELESILSAFTKKTWEGGVSGSGVSLKLVELGNEADLYKNNGHREKTYNESAYVDEWKSYIGNLIETTSVGKKTPNTPKIQALSFGHSDYGTGKKFSPEYAFKDGLLDGKIRDYIGAISQHTYSGGCCTALIADLMNKTAIRGNLTVFENDIAAVKAQGLPYYMGETNTYFNHGVPKVSDAGGAALWLADYTLFGATIGIEKLYFHEGIGYKYNLIQPVPLPRNPDDATPYPTPLPPHVQSPYYGALVVAEFLGSSSTRKLTEIKFEEFDLSGYALYEEGKLKRVLLFNHVPYLKDADSGPGARGERPTYAVSLKGMEGVYAAPSGLKMKRHHKKRSYGVNFGIRPGSYSSSSHGGKQVSIKRLSIPYADQQTGLTWAGQSFDDATPKGKLVVTKQSVDDDVTVSATEAVLIEY